MDASASGRRLAEPQALPALTEPLLGAPDAKLEGTNTFVPVWAEPLVTAPGCNRSHTE